MNRPDGATLLDELRAQPESEWLEFKTARWNFDVDQFGKYVSAIANEANLHGRDGGWIIFGVADRIDPTSGRRPVAGSSFKGSAEALLKLKREVAASTTPTLTFSRVEEVEHPDCPPASRVLMMEVPAAPPGQPVAWKGHHYGRSGASLGALGSAQYDIIRRQVGSTDWTAAEVTDDASMLDAVALAQGRRRYAERHPSRAPEMTTWSDLRLLQELGLARETHLRRAALILFGRHEASALLQGSAPRLTWRLVDAAGEEVDYAHHPLPLVMALEALAARIRVWTVRLLPPGQLVPLELPSYDGWVIREALLNCIAHQDYVGGGRITVTESPHSLRFSNAGAFMPPSLDWVLRADTAMTRHRNPCLADAMVELGLIDTIKSGIRRMFRTQRDRRFPLPDFEFPTDPAGVEVVIHGREIDPAFTQALMSATDLSLDDVIALDHIQKRRPVDRTVLADLRRRGLVEGRGKVLHIAASVAAAVGQKGQYNRQRGLDKPALKQLVLSLIDRFDQASRRDVEQALLEALPASLTIEQRRRRIQKLLAEMSGRDRTIRANHRGIGAMWTRRAALMPSPEIAKS